MIQARSLAIRIGILLAISALLITTIVVTSLSALRTIKVQEVLMSELFANSQQTMQPTFKGDEEARVRIVREFLARYHSPLEPYARLLVETADREGIHYGLLPAIAMVESGLCKHIPKNSHNCWGWGIYGKKVTKFSSYGEAIDTVARGLKKNYIMKGYDTPEKIVKNYNPSNTNNWSQNVRHFYNLFE